MNNENKAMCFYLDWIDALKMLKPDEAMKIVIAIGDFVKNGTEFPTFDNPLTEIAGIFIFQQLKRSKERSELKRKAGIASGVSRRAKSASRGDTAEAASDTAVY